MKKNIFILGDSYSTFTGFIPEENECYYFGDVRNNTAFVGDVTKTWWGRLCGEMGYEVVKNDSYSGSTVCNTTTPRPVWTSFVSRLDKYIGEGFFEKNNVDKFFLFGATNDSWRDMPVGKIKYEDLTKEDLDCVLPAFCYIIPKLIDLLGKENVVVIINTELKDEIASGIEEIAKKYDVKYVKLENITKEYGHPNEEGMAQIACQVKQVL